MRLGKVVIVGVMLLVGCTGSSSKDLTSIVAGTWHCNLHNGASPQGQFTASVSISKGHTYDVALHVGGATQHISGTWRLAGTTASLTIRTLGGTSARSYVGVRVGTTTIDVLDKKLIEGKFAVKWIDDDHIWFQQTQSLGQPSQEWRADCSKTA